MRSIEPDRARQTLNGLPDAEAIMKTLSTSTNLSSLIATAIFGALALSCGAVSTAADSSDPHQVVVKVADLNLSTQQGAAALYRRIAAAANEACESYLVNSWDLLAAEKIQGCVQKAIADAVTKVGRPELFAIYNAKNHRPAPALVAKAQTR
jgi:UrcA family protein